MKDKKVLTYSEGKAILLTLFKGYRKMKLHKELQDEGKLSFDINFTNQVSIFERIVKEVANSNLGYALIIENDFENINPNREWYNSSKDAQQASISAKSSYYKAKHKWAIGVLIWIT